MSHYQKLRHVSEFKDSIHNIGKGAGGGGKNIGNPKSDFRCDVEIVLDGIVPSKNRNRFNVTYASWTDNSIEMEMLADKMLGGQRHSWEQRAGAKFIETGLYRR
jgi:hypothetical protein